MFFERRMDEVPPPLSGPPLSGKGGEEGRKDKREREGRPFLRLLSLGRRNRRRKREKGGREGAALLCITSAPSLSSPLPSQNQARKLEKIERR